MFGGAHEQQLQDQVPQTQAPTTTAAATAEEEALKRNTDCVYFLASPLTCKKGSDCEYRHSEVARLNPRDCWFWLNGNCLNPKCGFRHPPLDGLLGTQAPTPLGHSLPTSHSIPVPAAQALSVPGKQAVPCIFFQKGYCLKGDKCPFLHAPNSAINKVSQPAVATPVTGSLSAKKAFVSLEKCTQDQKISQTNVSKSVELPPQAKPVLRVEMGPLRNGISINRNMPIPTGLDEELPRCEPANVHPASNGNTVSRSNRVHQFHVPDDQSILSTKDADEFSREPSPGFDVLVDDELRDSDYYPNEDQFGRTRGHEGRNLSPIDDYDIGRPDYSSTPDVDRDVFRDRRGYDSFERQQGHYGWDEHRASSERMLGGSGHLERRRYPRAESPDRIVESDLRHQLAKQKRGNGLRSVISRDHARENHVEDQNYRPPRREAHHLPAHESSVSSRFRGRIRIPERSTSPLNKYDPRQEREVDRERHWGRLSTERPNGRLRDRIKGRVQEDLSNEDRNFRASRMARNIVDDNNFSGPKSLAELKVGKKPENHEQHMNDRQALGKRKYPRLEGLQQSEGDLSFEGPKPLSEILKRKRGGETSVCESGMSSSSIEVNNVKEGKESLMILTETKETKVVLSSVSTDGVNRVHSNNEEFKSEAGGIGEPEEKSKPTESQPFLEHNGSELEKEEGIIGEEAMIDHELEPYDQGEESYYEQGDGENYNLDEGENADPEDEYFEDDDADDFAKKIGVMYS